MQERSELNPRELDHLREDRVYDAFLTGLITYYFVTKAPEAFIDFAEDVANQGSFDWKRAIALGVSTLFTAASWQVVVEDNARVNELKQKQMESQMEASF